jgi:serine protease AprX
MTLKDDDLHRLIFRAGRSRRYTQDSPVMPDVWLAFGSAGEKRVDLLLTPHTGAAPGELAAELHRRTKKAHVAHSDTYVVASLTLEELVTAALPLTLWWHESILGASTPDAADRYLEGWARRRGSRTDGLAPQVKWLIEVVGRIRIGTDPAGRGIEAAAKRVLAKSVREPDDRPGPWKGLLWQVSRNRPVELALSASRLAVKADATVQLFNIDCRALAWAVIDCGVDATHPALRTRGDEDKKLIEPPFERDAAGRLRNNTRVVATYDFTKLRTHLDPDAKLAKQLTPDERARVQELRTGLLNGRSIDWATLEPVLRVNHDPAPGVYESPVLEHGTHVAGILTSDWLTTDDGMPEGANLIGIAPGLNVYDLRVINETEGDEFSVIAALQFVRWLNGYKDRPAIHGVNLSLSIHHDVANFACGKTPVCQECERLSASGVVVVAAAGNLGYAQYQTLQGIPDAGFRSVSITDPGNAEAVITVGGTHRSRPFSYGISYFSSRGPTGDGRYKPDIVAPAEKITSSVPGAAAKSLDGTSMAAPHVSGAAALLLARNEDMVGDPARVKRILCDSATDLGRERYFQGAGMLDVLRALQSA